MSYVTKVHFDHGGERLTVESGGSINIQTGGQLLNNGVAAALVTAQAAIADLDQNISGTYVEAEVQAISDKVDAILAALRAAGIIAAS